MRVPFLTCCEVTPWHHNDATWLLVLGQLGRLEPNLPGVARTEWRTYVGVVRNSGWVCASEARQLELGSAASLRGALHDSRVDYTAMAPRLVWQQLTLDLSSPPPSSGTEQHMWPETHGHTRFMLTSEKTPSLERARVRQRALYANTYRTKRAARDTFKA